MVKQVTMKHQNTLCKQWLPTLVIMDTTYLDLVQGLVRAQETGIINHHQGINHDNHNAYNVINNIFYLVSISIEIDNTDTNNCLN